MGAARTIGGSQATSNRTLGSCPTQRGAHEILRSLLCKTAWNRQQFSREIAKLSRASLKNEKPRRNAGFFV